MEVTFNVYDRRNVHAKTGKEWVLSVKFETLNQWTIATWDRKPAQSTVDKAIEITLRAFKAYHSNIKQPVYEVIVYDETGHVNS